MVDLRTTTTTERHYGADLAEFLGAPEAVQDAFMAQLAEQEHADTDFRRWMSEVEDDDPAPPRLGPNLQRRLVRWDDTWRKRARHARSAKQTDGRDWQAEHDLLLGLESASYIFELTGEQVRFGKARCVLLDHEERTGSLHAYPDDGGWYCFGCGRGGTVYDLAGLLWDLDTRGSQFSEIHDRLLEIFA